MTRNGAATVALTGVLSLILCSGSISFGREAADSPAAAMAQSARFPNTLCVVLGCGDGSLAAALAHEGRYIVHALDPDAEKVAQARATLLAAGGYGLRASVERSSLKKLPYADNLAKVMVVNAPVSVDEIVRVVQPRGAVFILRGVSADKLQSAVGATGLGKSTVEKRAGWTRVGIPADPRHGDWTHWEGTPGRANFSADRSVKPPFRMQWVGGQVDGLHVVLNGRIFLSRPRAVPLIPEQRFYRTLTARDAYSGLLLWQREIRPPKGENWTYKKWLTAVGNTIIAADGIVITSCLRAQDTVEVYDAATGELKATYKSPGVAHLAYQDGVLYGDRKGICAVKAETGEPLWQFPAVKHGGAFAVGRSALFFSPIRPKDNGVVAVALGTGKQKWINTEVGHVSKGGGIAYHDGRVFVANSRGAFVLSAADGKVLWKQKTEQRSIRYWASAILAEDRLLSRYGIYALATGELLHHPKGSYPGGRGGGGCARGPVAAASGWVFSGRVAGMLNWRTYQSGKIGPVRGNCVGGVVPACGQLHFTPGTCQCFPLRDGITLAPAGDWRPGQSDPVSSRLEKGPAYGTTGVVKTGADDWPRYRRDNGHSAASEAPMRLPLKKLWMAKLEGQLTPPAVVGGKVFIGSNAHRVWCLDAKSGAVDWTYVTDGAVTVTPTVHDGRLLFGSYDGWVYCLNAGSGKLCWRFRAAPERRKVVIFDKLSSGWPVESGVLVKDGVAFAAAGWYGNDGMHYYGLRPATGEVVWARQDQTQSFDGGGVPASLGKYILSPVGNQVLDPQTGRKRSKFGGGRNRGVHHVYRAGRWAIRGSEDLACSTRGEGLLWTWGPSPRGKRTSPGAARAPTLRLSGFLDHGKGLWNQRGLRGNQLVFTKNRLYALKWFPSSRELEDGKKKEEMEYKKLNKKYSVWVWYKLLGSMTRDCGRNPHLVAYSCDATADNLLGTLKELWTLPVKPYKNWGAFNAMILAGDTLLAANPGTKKLWAIKAADGTKLGEYALPDATARDGLAAVGGRLYVALEGGSVLCLGN